MEAKECFQILSKENNSSEGQAWNPLTNFILENNDQSFKEAITKFNKFNNKEVHLDLSRDNSES